LSRSRAWRRTTYTDPRRATKVLRGPSEPSFSARQTFNQRVPGSSPGAPTSNTKRPSCWLVCDFPVSLRDAWAGRAGEGGADDGGSADGSRGSRGAGAGEGGGDAGTGPPVAGDRAGPRGRKPRRGGPQQRHGPADAARLGAPLQRRRAGRSARPQGARPAAAAGPGAGALSGERPRARAGRGGALAPDRSLRLGRAPLRCALPGARHGQAGPGARLQPGLGPAAAPQVRSRGPSRVQKKLADRMAAAVGDRAQGRRLELWFQML
jgi:hypothetical protein